MVEPAHPQLRVRRQCQMLALNRNRLTPAAPERFPMKDLELARKIDEVALRFPEFGVRRMSHYVKLEGFQTTRRRVARVMQGMGLEAIYPKRPTSTPGADHKIYPYLLRDLEVREAGEVWCPDITYIPMKRGSWYGKKERLIFRFLILFEASPATKVPKAVAL